MKYFAFWAPVLLCLLFSCRNTTPPPGAGKSVEFGQLPQDFRTFYERFHADSAYQMAHISWPLRGESTTQADSTAAPERKLVSWEPAQWVIQHPVDFSTHEFKGEWELTGNDFVVERIRYAAANYGLERHFVRRDDGDWELMYYQDMSGE